MFDFAEAAKIGFPCKKVTSDLFEDHRSLHSKLFDIECKRGRLIVTGSANATLPALSGRNVEAVVVRPADISTSLGWRATTRSDSVSTEEREPASSGGAGLVVDFNGGIVTGRVAGMASGLRWGTRRRSTSAHLSS